MAKEAFYFSHDTGARNDPKLQKVLMKLGHAGKSVFWDLVEMLHEEGGYLKMSECENYAFALRTEVSCITSLINDFDLFENDGEKFWSESALRRINQRETKSKKAAESAKIRWENANAYKTDANALQNECEGNAIKERKGNEIDNKKNNKKEKFLRPTIQQVEEYITEKDGEVTAGIEAEKFYNYYESNGWKVGRSAMKNWKAAIHNWIANSKKYNNNGTQPNHGQSSGAIKLVHSAKTAYDRINGL